MTIKCTVSLRKAEAEAVAKFAEERGLTESRALRELIRRGLEAHGYEVPEEEPKRGRRGGGSHAKAGRR